MSAPPVARDPNPTARPEYKRIRRAVLRALARPGSKLGLFSDVVDEIALALFRMIEDDRATSSALLGKAFEQYAPLDADKVRRIQGVIENRVDVDPRRGVIAINGYEVKF